MTDDLELQKILQLLRGALTAADDMRHMREHDLRVSDLAGRLYGVRLAHFLQVNGAAKPAEPIVLGGSELPKDVAAGLGLLAPTWEHDERARDAIAEAWNIFDMAAELIPTYRKLADPESDFDPEGSWGADGVPALAEIARIVFGNAEVLMGGEKRQICENIQRRWDELATLAKRVQL